MEKEISKIVEEARLEERERERRKANLIIYNAPEADGPDALTIRNKELELVRMVFTEIVGEQDSRNIPIKFMKRLGNTQGEVDASRPLLVVLESVDTKFKLLGNAKKLGDSRNQQIKEIRIAHDRTVKERQNYKKLVSELALIFSFWLREPAILR